VGKHPGRYSDINIDYVYWINGLGDLYKGGINIILLIFIGPCIIVIVEE
jgi:hypothetical protein